MSRGFSRRTKKCHFYALHLPGRKEDHFPIPDICAHALKWKGQTSFRESCKKWLHSEKKIYHSKGTFAQICANLNLRGNLDRNKGAQMISSYCSGAATAFCRIFDSQLFKQSSLGPKHVRRIAPGGTDARESVDRDCISKSVEEEESLLPPVPESESARPAVISASNP